MDSDDEENPKLASRTESTLLDDSDSDDSLPFQKPTFRQDRTKSDLDAKAKADRFLEQALRSCQREKELHIAISKHSKDEDDDILPAEKLKQFLESSKSPLPAEKEVAPMGEAHPTHFKLFSWGDLPFLSKFCHPSYSRSQLLNLLDEIVLQKSEPFSTPLHALLSYHLEQDTLDSVLSRPPFRRHLLRNHQLPRDFVLWLLVTACSHLRSNDDPKEYVERLAHGAYKFLLEAIRTTHKDVCLSVADLSWHMQFSFGWMQRKATSDEPVPQAPVSNSAPMPSILSLSRFFHLWSMLFEHHMVAPLEGQDDCDKALESLSTFVFLSLDPILEGSSTIHHSHLRLFFQRTISYLADHMHSCHDVEHETIVGSVASSFEKAHDAIWEYTMANEEAGPVSSLRHSRIMRNLLISRGDVPWREVAVVHEYLRWCQGIVKSILVDTNISWEKLTRGTLKRWNHQKCCGDQYWSSLAHVVIALDSLTANVSETSRAQEFLALVETCYTMVHVSLHFIQKCPSHRDNEPLQHALSDIDVACRELVSKSNGHVFSNQYCLKLNYYLSCFRQYPRLEAERLQRIHESQTAENS
eukprot:Nitzschia sp. Nitz4//scaffold4_size323378//136083//137902//NITZ4_000655-RA/size323378-snap-gene-0.453-mRNA-1//-1//CDS//3329553384//915//frame0